MLAYSSLALTFFKPYSPFPLDITNLGSGIIGGSLEFLFFSLDVVD